MIVVAAVILLPFIGGLYSIGPIEFPCTYQTVQGKKTLKKLENDVQGLTIGGSSPSNVTKSTSIDCIDGSLNNPVSVKATFKLSSPISIAEAEAAVLTNQQIKKAGEQNYKPTTNLGARQDDPRMREVRITDLETTYAGDENAKYKVVYNLQSAVPCTAPTPPESKLDDSQCKGNDVFQRFELDKQPIKTVTITRSIIPAQE